MRKLSLPGVRGIGLAVAGAAAIALALPASGAIVLGSSTRLIQVSANNGGGLLTDSASAAGPGLFDAQREVEAFQTNPPQVLARGRARQTSDIDAVSISARGQAQVTVSLAATTLAPNQSTASGLSSFVVEFTLDTLSSYSLGGYVGNTLIQSGGPSLPALANTVLFEALDTSTTLFETLTDAENFSLTGTLGPGSYRLSAYADAQALQQSGAAFVSATGTSDFAFNFVATAIGTSVPEPSVPALLAAAALAAALTRRRRPRG